MMNIQEVDEQESCRQFFLNMLRARVKIASYECKGTLGCGSNLVDVFVPCEVFVNMNSYIGMINCNWCASLDISSILALSTQ